MTPEQIDAAEGAAVSVVLTPEERYLLHEAALDVLTDVEVTVHDSTNEWPFTGEPERPTRDDITEYGEEALVRIEAALVVAFERGKAGR